MNAQPVIALTADRPGFGASASASSSQDTTPDEAAALARLEALARVLDQAVRIPGTQIRFGLDAVLGLIPGVGDVATNLISAYLVMEARKLGVSRRDMARMIGNIAVDVGVAAIPVAGDVFDLFWRANDRNMAILREHLTRRGKIIDGEARAL